jgi:Histidine phosphatase superfamily (branch 2)
MAPKYRYQPLREEQDLVIEARPISPKRPRGRQARRLAAFLGLTFVGLVVVLFMTTWWVLIYFTEKSFIDSARGEIPQLPFLKSCHDRPDGYQCSPEISHFWGQYSPFHSVPSELPPEIPRNCEVTFAQVLSRHGSRDPTLGRTVVMAALLEKLQQDVRSFSGPYQFLRRYKYPLGADKLTAFGQGELVRSGEAFYKRYRSLTNATAPFVRASGQNRVVVSAQNFTQGMHKAALADNAPSAESYPLSILTIPEGTSSNNTLSAELCDAAQYEPYVSQGRRAQEKWAKIFAKPIVSRLNSDMPGAELTTSDAITLMDLCPFTTVAKPSGSLTPFCSLFTKKEWRDYDYYQTLGKYYSHGPGHPLGATQGVGFANELIARLTGQPVSDHTSVNHTLDSSPSTFPIGPSQKLFADFSHDNDMVAIYSGLGLYNTTMPLDKTRRTPPSAANGFAASWTVPFAGRLYVEKMRCRAQSHDVPTVEEGPEDGDELVRVLVNDRVVPLQRCDADALGRCRLEAFVESLGFAKKGGRWEECFERPHPAE